ncbi:glycoside hydrolase family 15 protein [Streptomyces sp. NPDC046197]|uniref:glycoside hydrolase family 15 protein n=1 Tax=Streptomyces sp. NPDC046197 TaxID=3154337 RepID=UPI0033C8D1D6
MVSTPFVGAAMSSIAIADYALISDRHSAALISRDGSVDWLCFPRFDSPSMFGRLLDEEAGHWSIRPSASCEVSRRYVEQTMVLETTFRTASGTVVLTDALLVGADNGGHRLGVGVPRLLARRVSGVDGEVPMETVYRPRPEYGLIAPILSATPGGVTSRGGAEWLVLTTPTAMSFTDASAHAAFTVRAGESLYFGMHRSTLEEAPAHVWPQEELAGRLQSTIAAWRSWSDLHQAYDGPWRELVHHSGRVLQALSFQPSGAIVAAATTSLPEGVGGERNWDYRYTWVRDASLTMEALWVAACPDEAQDFFSFLATAAPSLSKERSLQIMFGVGGEHDLSERTLPHLKGWRDSRPVRVGNGAWSQQQIDVYGELLDAAHRLADQLQRIDDDTRWFLIACADTAAERWTEKDQGIWEVRGEPRHFLYSKVMCWTALDRAIGLADRLGAPADKVVAWRRTREEIHDAVLREGWSEEAGAFTQYFGSTALDASNLMMPIVGFLPADDPRMVATIDATAERLTDDAGLVYRYRTEGGVDGLAGEEGTFLLCTFWLAQAMALAGQAERASGVFEQAAAYVNDVGLLAEEVDPATGELLGNFPQAFSHIGLVNAAWAISQARRPIAA